MFFKYNLTTTNEDGSTTDVIQTINLSKMIWAEITPETEEKKRTLHIMMEDMHEVTRQVPMPVKINNRTGQPALTKDGKVAVKYRTETSMQHMRFAFDDQSVVDKFLEIVDK